MDASEVSTIKTLALFDKLILRIAGADEATLRECPQQDWDNVRAVAEIMICTWLYQSALFSIIAHQIFASASQIRPDFILVSMFLATFILLVDSYMVMRSGWHLSGLTELKRGGIDISGGVAARVKAGIFLTIRILLTIAVAQLTAIFFSILIFRGDVFAQIQGEYVSSNAALIAAATGHVDAQIARDVEGLNAEKPRAVALASQVAALRQNQIDPTGNQPEIQQEQQELAQLLSEKLNADDALRQAETFASNELAGIRGSNQNSGVPGEGPVRRAAIEAVANAKDHATQLSAEVDAARARIDALHKRSVASGQVSKQQSESQLPHFESDLTAEDHKIAALQDEIAQLTDHREDAVRKDVEAAPEHVPADSGLAGQLSALEHIAKSNPKIAAVIILIDLTSFGFELAAVLAKVTSFVPTTYAALLARDSYMRIVRLVDAMILELDRDAEQEPSQSELHPPSMAAEEPRYRRQMEPELDPFASTEDPTFTQQRRPRGRPRKAPADGSSHGFVVPSNN